MLNPEVQALAKLIRDALPRLKEIPLAAEDVRGMLTSLGAWNDQTARVLEEAVRSVEEEFQIVILRRASIIAARPEWYHGPRPGDRHWPALQGYFTGPKGWDEDTVESIDEMSNEVVSLLENPAELQFSCRGLVVGYVQSGKTASMTAVISKSVDAGYNVIIVLAGLTDKLRQQTQRRMQSDIIDRNPDQWQRLTSSEIKGDLTSLTHGHLMSTERVQIAIMKKNVAPLDRLLEAIDATPASELKQLRVLLIDDECDQASVNSASREMDITKINERIRLLLKALPAVSYVGYTATPFANVLINPYAEKTEDLDDLYPKDFITSLPLPKGYFGTQSLFGRPPVDADDPTEDEEGLSMVRDIPAEDEAILQPRKRKDQAGFVPGMTESLQDAILYFLAACAARRVRGDDAQHMTMLVHTSSFVRMHESTADLIDAWLDEHRDSLAAGQGEMFGALEAVWERERVKVPSSVTSASPVAFDSLRAHLPAVLGALEVAVENGSSTDRIDYNGDPKTYIVVGGNILARGLTLEGLMVSYFLRTSNQYDTLLQMGRWFGYRTNYEDLPRLWMTTDLQTRFRALAAIEAEVREEIGMYSRKPQITPLDFAVRIRSIPGMIITARNKMRHARRCSVGYWGRHLQTIRFERRNGDRLARNWQAGAELVSFSKARRAAVTDRILFADVPRKLVVKFLRAYAVDPSHQDLSNELLLTFIEEGHSDLELWNVGVVTAAGGAESAQPLGDLGPVRTVNRSRLRHGDDSAADIKALMSRSDVAFDCPPGEVDLGQNWESLKARRRELVGEKPLLLLYPINRNSQARPWKKAGENPRVDLDAAHDILGFGIVMPQTREAGGDYVSVTLNPPSAEELDEIDAAELADAEAAGVD